MTPSERVAYIRGLMEGMKLDTGSDTGKLFSAITEALSDLAVGLEDAEDDISALYDSTEEISGELTELGDYVYGDWDEGNGGGDDDEEYVAICPNCSADVPITPEELESGSAVCPNCGEQLELDFDEQDYDFVYDNNYDDDDDGDDDDDNGEIDK